MERDEVSCEMSMAYENLVQHLKKKYGPAEGDYFANESMRSRNKHITRTSDGLYCHHIDEDKGDRLSSPDCARRQPWAWQSKERLVYCNILEHLILHVKIAILRMKRRPAEWFDLDRFFSPGVYMICESINNIFAQPPESDSPDYQTFNLIKENYEEYVMILQTMLCCMDTLYSSSKNGEDVLKVGGKIPYCGEKSQIIGIDQRGVTVQLDNGTIRKRSFVAIQSYISFRDKLDIIARRLSNGEHGILQSVYEKLDQALWTDTIHHCVKALMIDFRGYGFPQFSNNILGKEYGAENVDQYLSKAFDPVSSPDYEINEEAPVFWKGNLPDVVEEGYWYIARVETMFKLKSGYEATVWYPEPDLLRGGTGLLTDEDNNHLHRRGKLLSDSFVYDPIQKKSFDKYLNAKHEIVDATVIVSFTKEDLELFRKNYDILKFKMLDGCYFPDSKAVRQ